MGARGLPHGEHNLPRGFVLFNQRERIFDAIANLTAAKGYGALSLEDIAAEAAVSLQTFYTHFANKEEAFLATYEVGHAKAMAVINQTLEGQTSWVEAVRACVQALLEFLASEPSYAHLACVDVLIAHPHVANRLDEANAFYAELLTLQIGDDAPKLPPAPILGEAIVGGVFELLHDYILRGHTSELPELADHIVYLALTPLMGSERAWAAAALFSAGAGVSRAKRQERAPGWMLRLDVPVMHAAGVLRLGNETWQTDITHSQLAGGEHVEILNFIDDHSRLFLASVVFSTVKARDVVDVFHSAAQLHGLPASLLSGQRRRLQWHAPQGQGAPASRSSSGSASPPRTHAPTTHRPAARSSAYTRHSSAT